MIVPRKAMAAAMAAAVVLGGAVALYKFALPGLSAPGRSRRRWKLRWPCGCCAIACRPRLWQQHNPLGADAADAAAGRDVFRQNCEICHGYDGERKDADRGGEYPRPPASRGRSHVDDRRRDFLSHPQRHPEHGMPAWNLPDRQVWQLVLYMRDLPNTAALSADPAAGRRDGLAAGCALRGIRVPARRAIPASMTRWKKTPMANVVRDPQRASGRHHPGPLRPDPLRFLPRTTLRFVYGSIWKQRYFKKVGDDYFPFPAQWDVTHKIGGRTSSKERLVGDALPARQFPAADRPALRRLPLGQLRHRLPRPSPNGMSVASAAMGQGASTSSSRRARPSSTRPAWTMSMPTTPASNAIPRGGRSTTRLMASITTGRSASTWA